MTTRIKSILSKVYFTYLISILWTATILFLSLGKMPSQNNIKLNIPHLDKVVHFFMYFIYIIVLLWESRTRYKKSTIIATMLYCIFFGILMEYLQSAIFTYRSAEFFDFVFNTIGVFGGLFTFLFLIRVTKP